MKNQITKERILYTGIALVVIVLLIGAVNQTGYVFAGYKFVKEGYITIEDAKPNSAVFIDNKSRGNVDASGVGTFDRIKPGKRNIIVAAADSWPWVFDTHVQSNETSIITPLQIAQETQGEPLDDVSDPVHWQAKKEIRDYREPTSINPLERNGIKVWIEGTYIFVQKNEEVRVIHASTKPVRNIFWYRERDDAIVVASQNNVFVLDVRKSEIQNFLPVYTGTAPEAVADPLRPNYIFVKEGENYLALNI